MINFPWLSETEDAFVLRAPYGEEWKWNFTELTLEKCRPIALLVGESVASGFYYRPEFTLAQGLAQVWPQLQVADLTSVAFPYQSLEGWHEVVQRLAPSRLVLYAGNNLTSAFATAKPDVSRLPRQLEWLTGLADCEVSVVLPCFNPDWRPQEIASTATADYLLMEKAWEERPSEEFLRAQAALGCPSAHALLGESDAALECYQGFEELSPRLFSSVSRSIRQSCQELGLRLVDTTPLLESGGLLDYCHLSAEANRQVVEWVSGVPCTLSPSTATRARAHREAFLHLYGYGQYHLCESHLQALRELLASEEFQRFCLTFYRALFAARAVLAPDFFIRLSPSVRVASDFQFVFPPPSLEARLWEEAGRPLLPARPGRVNLLERRRWGVARLALLAQPYVDGRLQPRAYRPVWRSYFRGEEWRGGVLRAQLSLCPEAHGVALSLNGLELGRYPAVSAEVEFEHEVAPSDIQRYNELTLTVQLTERLDPHQVRRRGLMRLQRLELRD